MQKLQCTLLVLVRCPALLDQNDNDFLVQRAGQKKAGQNSGPGKTSGRAKMGRLNLDHEGFLADL